MVKRLGYTRKKIGEGNRKRRVAQSGLEGDGSPSSRSTQARIRGRDGHQHCAFPAVRLLSLKGSRAYAKVPRNRGVNTTLLASMSLRGWVLAVEGTTTATVFEAYVEQVFAPSLRRGQIGRSWWWTTSSLKRARGSGNCSKNGAANYSSCPRIRLLFNPIEESFSKIKGALRKAGAPNPRRPHRSARGSDLGGHREGCPRVLRVWGLPATRPSSMKHAVGC